MTKRWLSFLLVLTLLVSGFTGAAAAGVVAKGPGTSVITFVPYQTSYDVEAGDKFQGKAIGYFLADGVKPTAAQISIIAATDVIEVEYAGVPTGITFMVVNGTNADLVVTTPVFVEGEKTLSVFSQEGDQTPPGLDFARLLTPVDIKITAVKPITAMGDITWLRPTSVDGIDATTNTVSTGVKTNASNYDGALYVDITPVQGANTDDVVIWTSNNASVLSVEAGTKNNSSTYSRYRAVVKALKAGTAIVTAKTADGKFTKTMTITVKDVPPTTVSIPTPSPAPKAGEKTQLGLTWTTTDPTIKTGTWSIVSATTAGGVAITPASQAATIDATSGVLTAIMDGTVYVRFVADAKDANGAVVQTQPITGTAITIDSASGTVAAPTATYSLGDTKDAALETLPYTYNGAITVKLDTATVGAQIYYTLDDSEPTTASLLYNPNSQITISQSATLKAYAVKDGLTPSAKFNTSGYAFTIDPAITGITLAADTTTITGTDKATVTATLAGTGVTDAHKVNTWALSNNAKFTLAQPGTDANVRTIVATNAAKDGDTVKLTVTNDYDGTKKAEITLTYKAVSITGITLDKTTASIAANGQVELKATIAPANTSSSTTVSWFSSNVAAATVDSNGVVTGVASGSTIIRATVTDNGVVYTAQCAVTVIAATTQNAAPVFTVNKNADGNNISVNITSSTANAKVVYTYTTDGSEPTDPVASTTTATAPNPFVFAANTSYRFKAVAAGGTGTSTASGIASFTVDSNVAVKGVKLTATGYDEATKTLTVTGLRTLSDGLTATATLDPLNPKVDTMTWVSSAPSVVKVTPNATSNGVATASIETLAIGTSTITVTTTDGSFTDTITVKVVNVPVEANGVSILPSTAISIPVGNYAELTATVLPATLPNKSVTWTSNKPSVASVDANGKVTALAYDATTSANNTVAITATSVEKDANGNAVIAVKTITVTAPATDVAPITFWTKNATTGVLAQISSTGTPSYDVETEFVLKTATDGAEIYYTTDGTEPSKTNGKLFSGSFKLSETATIKAIAYKDDLNVRPVVSQVVNFSLKVTEVTVSKATATMEVGDKLTITYGFLPAAAVNGKTIIDANIVIADPTIVSKTSPHDATNKAITFTALKAGTTKITLSNGDNTIDKAVIEITVNKPAGMSIEVVGGDAITMGIGEIKKLVANLLPTKITNQTINWALSAADAATDVVTMNGAEVTANKAGTVKLVATAAYDSTVTKEVTVTVKADPDVIPNLPTQIPVYTASTKEFTAVEGNKLTTVVGTLAAGTGETYDQISYYYNVAVVETTAVGATFTIDDKGVVTMNIANVGAVTTTPKPIGYKWTLTAKSNRTGNTGTGSLNGESRTITGSTLTVNAAPTADEIAVAAAKTAIGALSVSIPMADAGTEAEAKAALLAELNKAIASTGIVLTAEDITISDFQEATGTTDGSFKYTVTLKSGTVTDTVSGTAKISATPTTAKISVTTTTMPYVGGKGVTNLAKADGSVTFTVEGYNVTNWKSSKTSVISINATTGVATLKKVGTGVTITATLEGGSKVTLKTAVQKIASVIAIQHKKSSWKAFPATGINVKVGAKRLTRTISTTPKSAKIYKADWVFADPTIAHRGSKGYIVGDKEGTTTVTVTLYNGVTATATVNVLSAKAYDALVEQGIEEPEVEQTEEIVVIDGVEEIIEVGTVEEAE